MNRKISLVATIVATLGAVPALAQEEFLRGDVNADGQLSIADAVMFHRWIVQGGPAPSCIDAADIDDSGEIELIGDPLYLLLRLFSTRGNDLPLPEPFPETGTDPTADDLGCESYEVEPPVPTTDVLRLDTVPAAAGQPVAIPLHLQNAQAVEALQLVVRYDPELFTPEDPHFAVSGAEGVRRSFQGTYFETLYQPWDQFNHRYLRTHEIAEEGLFRVGFVPELLQTGFEIPPGEHVVLNIIGRVSPNAPAGATIELEFAERESGLYGLQRTELTVRGQSRYVSLLPDTIPGRIEIVPDVTFFIRGDATGDESVNLADAQRTLEWLFRGGREPSCLDAADANDDGEINLADPVFTLRSLFTGGASLPQPYPDRGVDPTADAWECGRDL